MMRGPFGPTRAAGAGEALAAEGGAPGRVVVQGALQVRLLVELRVHKLMVLGEREGRESVCVCVWCVCVCVCVSVHVRKEGMLRQRLQERQAAESQRGAAPK